ncbi:MAG: hydantoinase B/oxoprolinase family protein [Deltaproteobacteria bacterium]|nr:MAG: hydantoinase B/oxoprolinase family protein [Deltaproteobacteria bacterium]
MSGRFDPITLEILWRRLLSIVDEADSAVARTAFSSLLRDAHDYTCMFTDRRGRELAQGTFATPGQSGAMALGIEKLVNTPLLQEAGPGDVFITNDPWALAGHLNDVCVLSPIFHGERLAGYTACVFHHSDIGGRVSSDNREVYEEGLFIPPVHLYRGGEANQAVLELIRANVRTPEQVVGDIRSQVAANHVCAEQVCRMLDEYHLDDLEDLAEEIIGRTERSMRAAIAELPDGRYGSEIVVEQKGGAELLLRAEVTVRGEELTVDLEGSSGQVDWGGNVVFNFTYAYVFMAVKSMLDPELPNNAGCARPIRLRAPEGSVVNCRPPAAVAARMQIGHFLTELVYRALAGAAPQRVIAGSGGTPATMNVFYGRRADGRPFHTVVIRGGGMGAGAGQDGAGVFIFPANGANTPAEIFESDTPLLVERRELIRDSGGAGRRRGAPALREVFRVPAGEEAPRGPVMLGVQTGRLRRAPQGLFGGRPGRRAAFLVDDEPADPYGLTTIAAGRRIVMETAGGGGFGDPLERETELVAGDVAAGYVSETAARNDYGVVLAADGTVDAGATEKLRAELRAARKDDTAGS